MLASGPENIESGAGWMDAGKLGIASAPTTLLEECSSAFNRHASRNGGSRAPLNDSDCDMRKHRARAIRELALLMRDRYGRREQAGTIKADLMRRSVWFDAVFRIGRSGCTGVDIGYQGRRKNFHQRDR
jgi:hypothetical protein